MSGKEFLQKIKHLSGEPGSKQQSAREVNDLVDLLSDADRKKIRKANTLELAVQALNTGAADLQDKVKQASTANTNLLEIYTSSGASAEQTYRAWLKQESASEGDNKEAADKIQELSTQGGSEAFHSKLNGAPDGTALQAVLDETESTIKTGLSQVDRVVRAISSPGGQAADDFIEFLAQREGSGDATAATVRKILSQSEIKGKVLDGETRLSEILDAIDADKTEAQNNLQKDMLKGGATKLLAAFNADPEGGSVSGSQRVVSRLLSAPQMWTIFAIIIAAGSIIGYFLYTGQLALFSDHDAARGFITLLFAVGAIAIFLVITSAIVFDVNSNSKDVYERAKTILSMMLGIFGTVLGFYYGLPKDDEETTGLSLQPIEFIAAPAGKLNFVTSVSGGKAPYEFLIQFANPKGEDLKAAVITVPSANGVLVIKEGIDTAVNKIEGKEVTVTITASDSEGKVVRKASDPHTVPKKPAEPSK